MPRRALVYPADRVPVSPVPVGFIVCPYYPRGGPRAVLNERTVACVVFEGAVHDGDLTCDFARVRLNIQANLRGGSIRVVEGATVHEHVIDAAGDRPTVPPGVV